MTPIGEVSTAPSAGGGQRLAALMVTAFVDTLGAFLVLALLPFYALELGASPIEVGALVAAFSVAQTATAPVWGRVSDRLGRRPVILLGLLLSIFGYLSFAAATSLFWLLVARLAQGVGGGTVSVVFAYIADSVPGHQRAERIGWVTSATSAAAMVGPAVGSLAARFDPAYPGLVVAALSALTLVFAWVALPETRRAQASNGASAAAEPPSLASALGRVVLRPATLAHRLIWVYALAMLATNGVTAISGLYLESRFAVDEGTVWPFFTTLAAVSLLVRATMLGPLVRRLREVRVLRLGAAALTVALFLLPVPTQPLGLALPLALFAVGNSLLYPCTTALISRSAPREGEMGQLLGVQQAFGGLSRIAGPIAAGALFESLSPRAPFLGASALIAVVAIGVWRGLRVDEPEGATPGS